MRGIPDFADAHPGYEAPLPRAWSSLPGLTRQSILFAKRVLRRRMDPRVKPGGDAVSGVSSSQANWNPFCRMAHPALPQSHGRELTRRPLPVRYNLGQAMRRSSVALLAGREKCG